MATFNAGAIEANLSLGRTAWVRDLKKTQKEIRDLENTNITIGVDADTINAQIAFDNIENQMNLLDTDGVMVKVDADTSEAMTGFEAVLNVAEILERMKIGVDVDANIASFQAEAGIVAATAEAMDGLDVDIPVDVDAAAAEAELALLEAQVEALDGQDVDIDIDVDALAAQAQLALLTAQVKTFDGKTATIDIDVDRDMLESLVGGGGGGGGYMGLLKILMLAIIALSPILSVATGALTATIASLAAVIVGMLGPIVILAAGLTGLIGRFNNAKEAGEKLSVPMQELDDAITDLGDAWDKFLDKIEVSGFGLMTTAVEVLTDVLGMLAPVFNATADMLSGLLDEFKVFVNSAEFKEWMDWFGTKGVEMLETFIRILGNVGNFLMNLFIAMQPFTDLMLDGLEDLTKGWAEWAEGLEDNEAFQRFLDNAMKYGPMVLDLLGSIVQAFINLGEALEPLAGPMLTGLIWFFDSIANMDPDMLLAIVLGLTGLWAVFHIILPIVTALTTLFPVLAAVIGFLLSPVGLVLLAIAALVGMFIYLWNTNDEFRKNMIAAWEDIKSKIEPIITSIVDYVKDHWGDMKEWAIGTWNDIKDMFVQFFQLVAVIFQIGAQILSTWWKMFGDDIMRFARGWITSIGGMFRGLVQILSGIFQLIKSVLTGDWKGMWEGIKKIFRGFVTFISGAIRGALTMWRAIWGVVWSTIKGVWNTGIFGLKDLWNGFRDWIGGKWTSLKNWFAGLKVSAAGMFDGIKGAFRSAINTVIGWWNGLSFSLPSINPPGPGPSIPGFTVSTPNIGYLAKGAYVTDPMLSVVGEGLDPEIVAPEPILRKIVAENNIDYGKLAAAVAAALASVMDRMPGVSAEDLERLIEAASVQLTIDARGDQNTVSKLAKAIGYELRVLGYGGRAAA